MQPILPIIYMTSIRPYKNLTKLVRIFTKLGKQNINNKRKSKTNCDVTNE